MEGAIEAGAAAHAEAAHPARAIALIEKGFLGSGRLHVGCEDGCQHSNRNRGYPHRDLLSPSGRHRVRGLTRTQSTRTDRNTFHRPYRSTMFIV
jgi:hypothetical protein